MQTGLLGVTFSGKIRYEGVRFNVISITRGGWGSNFLKKKRYVTLEWPHVFTAHLTLDDSVDSKQNVCDHPVILVHLVSIGTYP